MPVLWGIKSYEYDLTGNLFGYNCVCFLKIKHYFGNV